MNFGIIGYGTIGDIHAKIILTLPEGNLVAVATTSAQNGNTARERYGCEIYTDYHEMLKRDDIEIVVVCLPSGMHDRAALDIAASGKHCIVEKPISITSERTQKMIDAFESRSCKLSVVFQHRFDRSTQLLKEAIADGRLGQLHYGTAKTIWFRDDNYYHLRKSRGTWAGDGGGALMSQAIHTIDLLQYLMGPVEAVCGKCDTLGHPYMETEDIGLALLRFRSGALGTIEGTTLAYPGFATELNIHGQSGSIGLRNDAVHFCHLQCETPERLQALMQHGDDSIPYGAFNLVPFLRQYEDMMDAIRQNRAPLVSGEEGLKSIKIIEAIYASSRENQWITL